MSARTIHRPKTSQSEATALFDSIDRWKLAERFGIDRVHDKTRVQIYNAVSAGRPCADFQDVVADLAAADDRTPPALPILNWADFTNDLPEGKHVEFGSLQPMADAHRWLRETISRHCPFVSPSLNHGRIWMGVAKRRQTVGQHLLSVLRQGQDAFRHLSRPDDRNSLLNALMILVPEIEPTGHFGTADLLGAMRQDFGMEEADPEFTIGSFVPSEPRNAIADPHRAAPPVYVFRHKVAMTGRHMRPGDVLGQHGRQNGLRRDQEEA